MLAQFGRLHGIFDLRHHFCAVLVSLQNTKQKGRARVEPATYRAATDCSTTELTPRVEPERAELKGSGQINFVGGSIPGRYRKHNSEVV